MAELLVNELTVNKPIDEAWPIICDLEAIAPCLPGAQLEEIEGTIHRGNVVVKLGAITAKFKGEAEIVERDDEAHTAKLRAKGRDAGGRGSAEAVITAVAVAISPTSTQVNVTTEMQITGKVAQFGRGIMGEVSKKLMDQFAANLNTRLDERDDTAVHATDPAPSGDSAETAEQPQGVRKVAAPAVAPIDVAELAGPALAKRFLPLVVVALLLIVLLRRRR